MSGYKNDEIKQYPLTVLNVIIKQAYIPKVPLIPAEEAKDLINTASNIRTENPSKYYKVLAKIGHGGFASVYKCERKSDGMLCALKWL